jgi:alanyl aminopeptidase
VLEEREGRLELGPPAAGAAPGAGTAAARAAVRCPELLYANADEAGYYRIRLEPGDLPRLGGGAGIRLPERERFGLVGNAWAGVQSGALRAPAFLELLRSFRDEPSRLVWTQIVDALQAVDRALVPAEARPAFARYVRDLLGPTAQRLGWAPPPDETEDTKLLRELILGALGELGEDEWVLREAARIADASLAAPLTANADIARVAVPLAAKRGDATLFDRLLAALRSPPSPEIRVLALSGLAGFDDRALVERALALALDGTIKAQDLRYLFPAMGLRRAARDVTQAWIEAHIDELGRLFPAFLIGRFVRVTAALCDDGRVGTAEAALRPHLAKVEGVDKDLRQSVELGHRCAALAAAERAGTAAWLGGRSLAARRR